MDIGRATRSLISGAWLTLAALSPVSAQGTFDMPAGAHFNPQKLARIGEFFRDQIANGKIPGAVLLIEQHGKPVYHEWFGVQDVVSKRPMSDDTIFRLFSMTKPITSVAAMMLIDEGKLKLDDPVAKYIPSFAKARVGVEKKADNGEKVLDLVPLNRPITILDLMTQTSGITYGFYGDSMVRKAYAKARIYDGNFDNAEFAERIAALPLAEQPGTLWDYGHSTDILGRVIEVVSGKSLLQFEKEKLLDPLGMTGTSFYVTDPVKQKQIALPMPNDHDFRVGFDSSADVVMKWESGGGGMVSTLADLAQFSRMLLNRGSLGGKQYLSSQGVRGDDDGSRRAGLRRRARLFLFPRGRLRIRAWHRDPHRSRQRQAAAAGLARRIEMGRRQRLLFRDRSQAGHVFRAAGADAIGTPEDPAGIEKTDL